MLWIFCLLDIIVKQGGLDTIEMVRILDAVELVPTTDTETDRPLS